MSASAFFGGQTNSIFLHDLYCTARCTLISFRQPTSSNAANSWHKKILLKFAQFTQSTARLPKVQSWPLLYVTMSLFVYSGFEELVILAQFGGPPVITSKSVVSRPYSDPRSKHYCPGIQQNLGTKSWQWVQQNSLDPKLGSPIKH